MNHQEIEELLGAYALDAVDADEVLAIEEHLATCPRCRSEVAAHREVATMLGNAGGEAPDGLWERIAGELELEEVRELPPIPDLANVRTSRSNLPRVGVDGRPRRRLRPVAYSLAAVAAALALVVGLLSAKVSNLDGQVSSITSAMHAGGVAEEAAVAEANPAHRSIELAATTGEHAAVLVTLPDGHAYWITQSGVAGLPSNRSYQLWAAESDGKVVSLGLLGRAPTDVAVEVTPNMKRFMVTVEPVGGTVVPTTPVIIASQTISV